MSIEQMSAVLLTFEVLAVAALFLRHKKVHPLLLVQTLATAVAFVILFSAPGNEIRVASEIANWMPEYETMPFFISIRTVWDLESICPGAIRPGWEECRERRLCILHSG